MSLTLTASLALTAGGAVMLLTNRVIDVIEKRVYKYHNM